MAIHSLLLPSGREISSGGEEQFTLQKVTLTQSVNTAQSLFCGSVFASCLEVTCLQTGGECPLAPGDRVELYKDGEKEGIFYIQALEKTGKGLYKLTAYDSLSLLDRDLTQWLLGLAHWPYTLQELAGMVCSACGLTLKEGSLPSGTFPVKAFSGKNITGRMLLGWIGQVIGRFCRATVDGQAEFAWYTPVDRTLTPTGNNWYFRGGFRKEGDIPPIDQVLLRKDSTDVGTMYPPDITGENVYILEGNPLLSPESGEELLEIARNLYDLLAGISYTAGSVSVSTELGIAPGQILQAEDPEGEICTFYVMGKTSTGSKDTLTCMGVQDRQKGAIAAQTTVENLQGKVLHLQMDVDGIRAENVEKGQSLARLELDTQGIRTQVLQQQETVGGMKTQLSQLEQDGEKLSLRLTQMEETGPGKVTTETGYRFDSDGLFISKSGEEMENRLDNTGMYVRRSGQVILQANNQGVEATDVAVRNYLVVGDFARFEDYSTGADSHRTACFYIGG